MQFRPAVKEFTPLFPGQLGECDKCGNAYGETTEYVVGYSVVTGHLCPECRQCDDCGQDEQILKLDNGNVEVRCGCPSYRGFVIDMSSHRAFKRFEQVGWALSDALHPPVDPDDTWDELSSPNGSTDHAPTPDEAYRKQLGDEWEPPIVFKREVTR